jgi:2-iminobutanoate/2-iminopropanoate deaminase
MKRDTFRRVSLFVTLLSLTFALTWHKMNYQIIRSAYMYTSEGKKIIKTESAPQAIGPYSQAVGTDRMIYTAGQIALDPASMEVVSGGVEPETRQVLSNLKAVLEGANSGMKYVVKTTVFLRDMADFAKMNAVYAEFFPEDPPARSTVAVASLPKGVAVEIEAVALIAPGHGD